MFYVLVLRPVNDSANGVITLRLTLALRFCIKENLKKVLPFVYHFVGDKIKPVDKSADDVII